MSIDMYLSSSDGQATSTSETCRKQIKGYEELQQAIHDFTTNSASLTGEAYASAKRYFSAVLLPLAQGGMLLSEAVEQAVKKFPADYREQVDSGDLKQTELEEKIRQANQLLHQAENIKTSLLKIDNEDIMKDFQLSQNQVLIGIYQDLKQDLEKKLSKLLAFNTASSAIFKDIAALESAVRQGLAQTKSAWDGNAGVFVVPSTNNLIWSTIITKQAEKSSIQFLEDIRTKVPNLSEEEKTRLFLLAQTNPNINPPQEIIDYFLKDINEIPESIKNNLPEDLLVAGVETSGKTMQNLGYLLTVLTGKMGPGGAGDFIMVNPNTSTLTTNLIKTGSTVAKVGKFGLPIVGGIIDGVTQVVTGEDVGDAIIKSTVHVGIGFAGGEAGAAIGAAIGTAIPIPVVGTVVGGIIGFGVGVGITALGNYVFDKIYDKKDKIIEGAKDIAKDVGKKANKIADDIGNGIKGIGDKIGNATSGFMKGLGSAFG